MNSFFALRLTQDAREKDCKKRCQVTVKLYHHCFQININFRSLWLRATFYGSAVEWEKGCDGMFGYFTFFTKNTKNQFTQRSAYISQPSTSDEYEALEIFLIMTGFGILFFTQINFHCLHNYIASKDVLFSSIASNRGKEKFFLVS